MGELAGVAGGNANPQAGPAVGSPNVEVWQELLH